MYQFIHIEAYSKVSAKKKLEKSYNKETKGRNVSEIIAEATRKQDYCDHVALVRTPEPPILLYGVRPEELEKLTDDYFNNTKLTNNKGVVRGLRKDSHVLLAGIISLNREVEAIWDDYKKDAIEWLKAKYSDKLKCVIEHTDEENPHIHFYCVQDNGVSFDLLHDGKKEFSKVGGKLKYKKEIAFKNAMREFQEDFYNKVSVRYGLLKIGPKRARLSNSDYWQQKKEIELINNYKNKVNNEIKELKVIIKTEKTKAKKQGFNSGIKDFNNKNIFNKVITSLIYSKELNDENIKIKESNGRIYKRKEFYKKSFNNEVIKNNQLKIEIENFDNYKKLNMFLYDLDEKLKPTTEEEKENDNRRSIERLNEQIDSIEKQLKSESDRTQKIDRAITQNRRRINSIRSGINKVSRVLLINCYQFFRDLFSIESIETEFERRKNEKIDKFTEEEIKKISDSRKENRRFNNERTGFKIK